MSSRLHCIKALIIKIDYCYFGIEIDSFTYEFSVSKKANFANNFVC